MRNLRADHYFVVPGSLAFNSAKNFCGASIGVGDAIAAVTPAHRIISVWIEVGPGEVLQSAICLSIVVDANWSWPHAVDFLDQRNVRIAKNVCCKCVNSIRCIIWIECQMRPSFNTIVAASKTEPLKSNVVGIKRRRCCFVDFYNAWQYALWKIITRINRHEGAVIGKSGRGKWLTQRSSCQIGCGV